MSVDSTECERRRYYDYGKAREEYHCRVDLGEDEIHRILPSRSRCCPRSRQADT